MGGDDQKKIETKSGKKLKYFAKLHNFKCQMAKKVLYEKE
jgi:hypothetical protein